MIDDEDIELLRKCKDLFEKYRYEKNIPISIKRGFLSFSNGALETIIAIEHEINK
jgi:hypothetical protein